MKLKIFLVIMFLQQTTLLFALRSRVYFGHSIRSKIVQLIRDEKKSIKVAMYTFTDIIIAQALVQAAERNVRVECIVDGFTNRVPAGKGFYLRDAGIAVMQYAPSRQKSLMHNKYMIFSQTNIIDSVQGVPCVIAGSYNCTYNATFNNHENMIMISDKKTIERYRENFKKIKKESFYISKELAKRRSREE